MNIDDEWNTLCQRITSFHENMSLLPWERFAGDGCNHDDTASRFLLPHLRATIRKCEAYFDKFQNTLPPSAIEDAKEILRWLKQYAQEGGDVSKPGLGTARTLTVGLVSLRALLKPYFAASARAIGVTERALMHLQRSLIVDSDLRARWLAAFENSEVECEKLGAVHLLQHGIWAFKANAEGERTDLVLGEPLKVTEEIKRAATALVLTEWKRVKDPSEQNEMQRHARRQTAIYSSSSLAGFELDAVRYLVLVSRDRLVSAPEEYGDEVIYRYINIAVSPSTASRSARRRE